MARFARRGMTLVELLVVIAIIAILVSLLLPAILQARGAGRKVQCESNLKQLALAVQTFHQRNNCLPVYWGPMKGGGGQKFGGWLLHLLPDMDQQALYDMVPASTTSGSIQVMDQKWIAIDDQWEPAIPPSPDYNPGQWMNVKVGEGVVNGVVTEIWELQLVGRVGTPGKPKKRKTKLESTPRWTTSGNSGVAAELLTLAQGATLPFLTDAEDPGLVRSPQVPVGGGPQSLGNMQLTNYMANAHVFTKLNGGRITTGPDGGLFRAPFYQTAGTTPTVWPNQTHDPKLQSYWGWNHTVSGSTGPIGRTFDHVIDGLPNTILFAEGMRQCDNLAQYRAAFFPSGNPLHEHAFGIECQWRDPDTEEAVDLQESRGSTLMFQTMPKLREANPLRAQTLHGNYLMVAMCDGSTRAISSGVSRREPTAAAASGNETVGSVFYTAESRGAALPDGVWDMLMVPNDPPGNVLSNDGTIGREQ